MSRRGAARRARAGEGLRPYAHDVRYPLDGERGGEPENDSRQESKSSFEFIVTPAFEKPVLSAARALLAQGLTSAEVCSLFTHAASILAQQNDGLPRQEWLALCAELHDATDAEDAITAPGGSA